MKRFLLCLTAVFVLFASGCTPYDHATPDTKANRKIFKSITRIAPDSTVKNLYAYADEFIKDPLYCAAFTAPPQTVEKIIKKLDLKKQPPEENCDLDLGPANFIPWWKPELRKNSQLYKAHILHKVIYFLWYDPKTEQCHIMEWCY